MENSSMLVALLPMVVLIVLVWAVARGIKRTASKYPAAAPDESTVHGVGGWLLLLVMGMTFLGPLMGAGSINSEFLAAEAQYPNLKTVAEWSSYKTATWWTFLAACGLSFYGGLGLIKERTASAVNRAKNILWITGPLNSILLGVVLPLVIFGNPALGPEFIGGMLATIIGVAIWTLYLSKSKRVKATYGTQNSGSPK